jgi:hypothetical protein
MYRTLTLLALLSLAAPGEFLRIEQSVNALD